MPESVIVAVIALFGSLAGTYFANRKASALIEYRLEQLEHKVDVHNSVIERTYKLEQVSAVRDEEMKVCQKRIADLERKVES